MSRHVSGVVSVYMTSVAVSAVYSKDGRRFRFHGINYLHSVALVSRDSQIRNGCKEIPILSLIIAWCSLVMSATHFNKSTAVSFNNYLKVGHFDKTLARS